MFNLQGSEIIIILLLALVVLGPEKLPDAMRKAGQFYAELKKMSTGFQSEFRAAVDEPLRELRETANVLRDSADFTKLQSGERDEKPKSADMASANEAPAEASPADELPSFEASAADDPAPELTEDSKAAPFMPVMTTGGRPTEASAAATAETAGDQRASVEPEVTESEVTEPEVTAPDVAEPEVTEPEVTAPEVTAPEVTAPEVTAPTSGEDLAATPDDQAADADDDE